MARVLLAVALLVLATGAATAVLLSRGDGGARPAPRASSEDRAAAPTSGPAPTPREPSPSPTPTPDPLHPLVDRRTVGQPWGTVLGLLQFRGNPTRSWYGTGPVPSDPVIRWRYPDRPMCTDEEVDGETKRWCGSGWTGQPAVWERPDGVTEVIVGTYDRAVHFIDAATGEPTRTPFPTGGLIKGSVTIDPDGYPLLYVGSRDNQLRILALDRPGRATELWSLSANPQRLWNNDWDGNPVVVDGILFEGGEDSWFYAFDLRRGYDAEGLVTVDPVPLLEVPGWNDELLDRLPDVNVSIESSVVVFEGRAYVANSGGRVMGFDVTDLRSSACPPTAERGSCPADRAAIPLAFDYWMGDDVDATITVDDEGMLYVAAELERFLPRAREVGQLVKLDPTRAGDPLVWSIPVPPRPSIPDDAGGIWSTPAVRDGLLYVTTHPGDLLVIDTATGEVVWRERIGYHEWSSPVLVDDTLIVGACEQGALLAWSLTDPRQPTERWRMDIPTGACIESTPAVWAGGIYVGARDGYIYGVGDG